jgi:hypothetical protein
LRRGRAACHCADGRRAFSAFNVSRPIRWQAAPRSSSRRRQGHLAGSVPAGSAGEQCARAKQRTVLSLLQEASPARRRYTDLGRQDTRRLPQQQIFIVPSVIFSMSLGPYVGAQCLCACPPFSYKRGGMRRCEANSKQTLSSSYKLPSNTSHSGVGYYAPAARTTLNPRVLSCVDPLVS